MPTGVYPRKTMRNKILDHTEKHPETGCWLWQRATQYGYGITSRPNYGKSVAAHRVAYEEFIGPIPIGATVTQTCGNRACCNPEHLEAHTP